MKVYIVCGLTHVPRHEFSEYVCLIESLAAHLTRHLGAEVKYALKHSDPQLADKPFLERARFCYLWDKEMVEWADVVVAETSFPSTGLGIELQVACALGTPAVLLFKLDEHHRAAPIEYQTGEETYSLQVGDGYVSLMALGMPNILRVFPYASAEEVLLEVANALEPLKESNNGQA